MQTAHKFYFEIYDQNTILALDDFMQKFNIKNQVKKLQLKEKKQSILDYAGAFDGYFSDIDAKNIKQKMADSI